VARALPGGDNRHVLWGVEERFGSGGSQSRHALPTLAGGGGERIGIPVDFPGPPLAITRQDAMDLKGLNLHRS
jgi:hypothetical protein